jgi:voltage-gated sodium channel
VSFVVLAVFVVINLFVAIVINDLEAAKREQERAAGSEREPLARRLAGMRKELEAIEAELRPPGDG